MKLTERLEGKGVLLNQDIGFIIHELDDTNVWYATSAVVGQVHEDIPPDAADYEWFQDYNPEYDLLVKWRQDNQWLMCRLSNEVDAEFQIIENVNGVKLDGICIQSSDRRILIGQSPLFLDFANSNWCAFENKLH